MWRKVPSSVWDISHIVHLSREKLQTETQQKCCYKYQSINQTLFLQDLSQK